MISILPILLVVNVESQFCSLICPLSHLFTLQLSQFYHYPFSICRISNMQTYLIQQMPPSIVRLWSRTNKMPHVPFLSSSKFIVASADLKEAFGSSFQHESTVQFIIHSILPLVIFNMQNYQHAKRSNSTKARINRKHIMQQKRHPHAQSSSQPTINCASEYDSETSDIACFARNQFTQLA